MKSSRNEALAAGDPHYLTGTPCKRGHYSARLTSNGTCLACHAAKEREWARKNRHAKKERYQRDYKNNAEKYRARARLHRLFVIPNRPDRKQSERLAKSRWKLNNPDAVRSNFAARRARKISATPSWLCANDHQTIKAIYRLAIELTESTGIEHHVDHIVPLLGKTVCGLHVPWNLQVITKEENLRKSNKLEIGA